MSTAIVLLRMLYQDFATSTTATHIRVTVTDKVSQRKRLLMTAVPIKSSKVDVLAIFTAKSTAMLLLILLLKILLQ